MIHASPLAILRNICQVRGARQKRNYTTSFVWSSGLQLIYGEKEWQRGRETERERVFPRNSKFPGRKPWITFVTPMTSTLCLPDCPLHKHASWRRQEFGIGTSSTSEREEQKPVSERGPRTFSIALIRVLVRRAEPPASPGNQKLWEQSHHFS